jgi:hypothetical protein
METLKLLLATVGLLVIIIGFFFVAFTLLGKGKESKEDCETASSSPRAYGCGCGTGACGLPADRGKGQL